MSLSFLFSLFSPKYIYFFSFFPNLRPTRSFSSSSSFSSSHPSSSSSSSSSTVSSTFSSVITRSRLRLNKINANFLRGGDDDSAATSLRFCAPGKTAFVFAFRERSRHDKLIIPRGERLSRPCAAAVCVHKTMFKSVDKKLSGPRTRLLPPSPSTSSRRQSEDRPGCRVSSFPRFVILRERGNVSHSTRKAKTIILSVHPKIGS